MTFRILPLALAMALSNLVSMAPVQAHEGHDHAGGHAPAAAPDHDHHHDSVHGGIVRTAGDHHLELVPSRKTFSLWIQDGEQHDLPVKGAQGKLIVKMAGQTAQVFVLHPAGDHLEAAVNFPSGGHMPAIVQVSFEGERLSARFPVDL